MSALKVAMEPSWSTATSVTAVPVVLVWSATALAFLSRVTLGCSSAGRTASTSASDFAWTRQGKPSQVGQRTQAPWAMSASFSSTPQGAWNGCCPAAARSSASCWTRGSWDTVGNG
jgi:hypothetical protein